MYKSKKIRDLWLVNGLVAVLIQNNFLKPDLKYSDKADLLMGPIEENIRQTPVFSPFNLKIWLFSDIMFQKLGL